MIFKKKNYFRTPFSGDYVRPECAADFITSSQNGTLEISKETSSEVTCHWPLTPPCGQIKWKISNLNIPWSQNCVQNGLSLYLPDGSKIGPFCNKEDIIICPGQYGSDKSGGIYINYLNDRLGFSINY